MDKVIYYFSGTGNSLRISRIIAEKIGGAHLISMRNAPETFPAVQADMIGIVCPVYEWDAPQRVKEFVEKLNINPNAYIFMIATYIAIHGRCFETVATIIRKKGGQLNYGRPLRCVASQCTAYEPFPFPKIMVPRSDNKARQVGDEIAKRKYRKYPKMSLITKQLYPKMMLPFINVEHEYDKGFYTSDKCIGCEVCRKVCPCNNITFVSKRPIWNHACLGCMACVVYCPTKAIQFQTPEAYVQLNNIISRKLDLSEKRTRYHNPHVSANDLMQSSEIITAPVLNVSGDSNKGEIKPE